jgi:hypothetical protein
VFGIPVLKLVLMLRKTNSLSSVDTLVPLRSMAAARNGDVVGGDVCDWIPSNIWASSSKKYQYS